MPTAARGHQTLSAYISSRFDEFSRSQKDVAQYVVDHLDEVAFHTAEELARRVSRSEVEGAIELISTASRVLIAGTDQMAFFASYLRHLLMLLDIRAEIAASPSQEALSRLGRIDGGTLVIGLSAGRPHPLVVRAMKIAKHRRAPTIAIVDATLSEVAKLSDRTLYYSSNSPAFVRSHTGLLSILQALAYGIYSRDTSQYDERIRAFKLK